MGDGSGNLLFVYGTLIPTEPAWPVVAPYAVAHRPDRITGALFDTTWGFPALSLDPRHPLTVVPGAVIWLEPDRLGEALAVLDRYEGLAHDQYRRVMVDSAAGLRCWVYEWLGPTGSFEPLSTGWAEWVRRPPDCICIDPALIDPALIDPALIDRALIRSGTALIDPAAARNPCRCWTSGGA